MKNRLLTILACSIASQCFANEASAAEQDFTIFANQLTPDEQGWVQLAPYGDFPNLDKAGKAVIQRFRKPDAEAIVNEFKSLTNLPQRLLGLPWYIGHPDHPRFRGQPGHTDTAAKGRIKDLQAREDGLYANVKFSAAGKQLIDDEAFHGHSVNWHAVPTGSEGGKTVFSPRGLKSVGFTNQPQIPVTPVTMANEQTEAAPAWLLTLSGLAAGASIQEAATAIEQRLANEGQGKAPFLVTLDEAGGVTVELVNEAEAPRVLELVSGLKTAKSDLETAKAETARLTTALANERLARATLIVEPLVKTGKITVGDKAAKIAELSKAGDAFEALANALGAAATVVKTTAKTAALGRANVELQTDARARQAKFEAMMAARAEEFPNEDYMPRYEAVMNTAEGQQLFTQMKRAGAEE